MSHSTYRWQRDAPMSAAEFRCLMEGIGLTIEWAAYALDVRERTVQRWRDGAVDVPPRVADRLRDLLKQSDEATDSLARMVVDGEAADEATTRFLGADVMRSAGGRPTLVTYRTDADYAAAVPTSPWPASWHRRIVWEVSMETGCGIKFV